MSDSGTYLVIILKDAAEIEETSGSKVGWDLLGLPRAGNVLHLRTVHHAQIGRDLKGALGLGLRRQVGRLACLVLGLFRGLLLGIKGHKHRLRLLLLLCLLLLCEGVVRPWWLHTVGDSGCWG